MTGKADLSAPGRIKIRVVLLVGVLHLLGVIALIHAFAPDLAGRAVQGVVSTFAVEAPSPSPSPQPTPKQQRGAEAGTAGAAGKQAIPRAVAAPPPRVPIERQASAPSVAATGSADTSGLRDAGRGSGAVAAGNGTGSSGAGSGQGGGGSAAVKIAGDINSARDYPIASRDLRIGDYVIVALTVGIDGKPSACRVVRASRDPQANAITCALALARFRFRPATDATGQPIISTFGWQQRWFYRGGQ